MEYGVSALIAEMLHLNQDAQCGSPPSMDIKEGNSHCCDVAFCSVLAFVKAGHYDELCLGKTSPI